MQLFHICFCNIKTVSKLYLYSIKIHISSTSSFLPNLMLFIFFILFVKSQEVKRDAVVKWYLFLEHRRKLLPFEFIEIRSKNWNWNAKLNWMLNPINNTWNWTNKQRKAANGNFFGCLSFVELSMLTCFCWEDVNEIRKMFGDVWGFWDILWRV